jgi:hypothetical protein
VRSHGVSAVAYFLSWPFFKASIAGLLVTVLLTITLKVLLFPSRHPEKRLMRVTGWGD